MVLLEIDEHPVTDMTPREARLLLAGALDSEVRLRLLAPDGRRRDVTLRRAEFPVESVRGVLRGPAGWTYTVDADRRIACIGVCEFVRDTARDVQTALSGLGDPAGVILDLRDNPGGLLEEAVQLANLFLEEGQIVAVAQRQGVAQRHFARKADTCSHIPLVVLVNEGTASAAEIVAGALSFHSRALIVGERSCGKGSIQSMLLLPRDLGQINLTTGEFLLAGRVSILRSADSPRWGVEPDVRATIDPSEREGLDALRAEAGALLRRPAEVASDRPADPAEPGARHGSERIVEDLLTLDAPLRRAVKLLDDPQERRVLLRRRSAAWRRRVEETEDEEPAR
jgi:carboxyl-terminal processing protease